MKIFKTQNTDCALSQMMIKTRSALSFLTTTFLVSSVVIALFSLRHIFSVDVANATIAEVVSFPSSGSDRESSVAFLNTTLCTDKCFGECENYLTPMEQCYNGHKLFPPFQIEQAHGQNRSNPYGKYDIFDEVIKNSEEIVVAIKRSFFESTDSACENATGSFEQIPLQVCVGPFGKPLPWGSLKIASVETLDWQKGQKSTE